MLTPRITAQAAGDGFVVIHLARVSELTLPDSNLLLRPTELNIQCLHFKE